jgi:hypothetical protein
MKEELDDTHKCACERSEVGPHLQQQSSIQTARLSRNVCVRGVRGWCRWVRTEEGKLRCVLCCTRPSPTGKRHLREFHSFAYVFRSSRPEPPTPS